MSAGRRGDGSGEARAFLTLGGRASDAAAMPPAAAAPPSRRRRLKPPVPPEGVAVSVIKVLSTGRPDAVATIRPIDQMISPMLGGVAVRTASDGWPMPNGPVNPAWSRGIPIPVGP
jgi:hypothetical protein